MTPRAGWLGLGAVLTALAGVELELVPAGAAGVGVGVITVAAVVAAGVMRRWRVVALAVGVASVLLRLSVPAVMAGPVTDPGPPPADERTWVAEVLTVGVPRDGMARGTLRLEPDPADARWRAPLPPGWRVHASLPRYPALVPGDRFAVTGAVEPPRGDGGDFAAYLVEQGFAGTMRVDRIETLRHGPGPLAQLEGRRRDAADLVGRMLGEPEGGLATGILIGIRERLGREVSEDFSTTGLSHVVAISGWNIALVGGIVAALLGAAGVGRRGRSVLVVLAIAGYTLLSGASASVVRAALMGGVAIAARASGRPGSAATALGLAVWLLVLAEPAMAADIGFQLSVAATAGLLAWGDRIGAWIGGLGGGRAPRWLAETLGVSLAAQLATLPLVLYHFGRLSLISPLANLLIAPLVAPAMLVSLLALLGGAAVAAGVPPLLLAPVALAGRIALGGMVGIADVLGGVPLASVTLEPPWDLAAAGVAVGLVALAIRPRVIRRRGGSTTVTSTPEPTAAGRAAESPGARSAGVRVGAGMVGSARRRAPAIAIGAGGAALLLAGAVAIARPVERRLAVTVLDIGQGDAILVEGPGGTRMLVDGGPDPDRLLSVLDARLPPWDRRVDLLVLTHPHEDHVAGLALLMDRYRVGRVAENGMLGDSPGDTAFRERLRTQGRIVSILAAGDRMRLDGVSVSVWWPERGSVPRRAPEDGRAVNDTSVVLELRFGSRRFLLMGDVEDDVDPRLLAAGIGEGGRADVLKVAHHGSRTASSAPFLEALRPRVAVASTGTGNRYGHPAPSTLERLASVGARVLRTDLDGSVTVSTDGRDLRVSATGGRTLPARAARADRVGAGGRADALGRDALGDPGVPIEPVDETRSVALLPLPCRIPGRSAADLRRGSPVPAVAPVPGPGVSTAAAAVHGPWLRPVRDPARAASALPCYDRSRDDPQSVRVGRHPAPPRRARLAAQPHAGGRGGGRIPGRTRQRARSARGSRARGERGPPP